MSTDANGLETTLLQKKMEVALQCFLFTFQSLLSRLMIQRAFLARFKHTIIATHIQFLNQTRELKETPVQ